MTEGRRKREKRRETKDRFPVLLAFSSPRSSLPRFPFPPAPSALRPPRFCVSSFISSFPPPSIHLPRLPLPLALSLILPRPSFVPLFSFAVLAPSLPCFFALLARFPCALLVIPPLDYTFEDLAHFLLLVLLPPLSPALPVAERPPARSPVAILAPSPGRAFATPCRQWIRRFRGYRAVCLRGAPRRW